MTCGGLDFENNRRFEKAILRAKNPRQTMKDISFFTRIFLYVFLGFSCIFFASCIIIIIIILWVRECTTFYHLGIIRATLISCGSIQRIWGIPLLPLYLFLFLFFGLFIVSICCIFIRYIF